MKTADLIGPALDRAVAKCEGERYRATVMYDGIGGEYPPHAYSTDWGQGGPIIERCGIGFHRNGKLIYSNDEKRWRANVIIALDLPPPRLGFDATGPTALVAAMRCYVASKLGDDIDLPENLQ